MSSLMDSLREWAGGKSVVVVGVGNELRGDDGAGVAVVRELQRKGLRAVAAGETPELYTDVIKGLACPKVLFVDAVDLGKNPGDVALLRADELADNRWDAHRPSLSLVMRYLEQEGAGECLLLGIQPAQITFGQSMSAAVRTAVEQISALLWELLAK
ncbi:MAG: hydrogenase maturation protease [candidate division KSB1 bacterium]|nr:hydrogenase maturation protease [candidate division KSB1 bacterium]